MAELAFPKPAPLRSRQYMQWIRMQGCLICKQSAQAAHVGDHGFGTKTDDTRTVPLCGEHHVSGSQSYHRLGRDKFEELHRLDLKEQIIRLIIRFMSECLEFGDK